MHTVDWIWQQPTWPQFTWQAARVAPLLRDCTLQQGRLLGAANAVANDCGAQYSLDTFLQNILTSSAIESEPLNAASVRSSLARRLGLADTGHASARSEGLAELMLDATQGHELPLSMARLFEWHAWLFAEQSALSSVAIGVGHLRGDEPMQVVSGRLDRPTVHFEAPPRANLERQVEAFLAWFAASRDADDLDPLVRAGIAHFWFVTLHPFDDGNGRLTRAITDLALAQAERQAIRLYAMSASILEDRRGYYAVLEASQNGSMDITAWLQWFLRTLLASLTQAGQRIERVIGKTRFWERHRTDELQSGQIKVLNRLLDGDLAAGKGGFEQGINAAQYQAVAKVSKATATRHLTDLLDKGCLIRLPGGGRSVRYRINPA